MGPTSGPAPSVVVFHVSSGWGCTSGPTAPARCGRTLDRAFHADHKIPLSLGGPTTVANGQALRTYCNLSKGKNHDVVM